MNTSTLIGIQFNLYPDVINL